MRKTGTSYGRRAAAVGALLALTVTGCGAAGDADSQSKAGTDQAASAPGRAPDAAGYAGKDGGPGKPSGSGPSSGPAKLSASQIVRTATVTVETEDVPAALATARAAAEGAGGYVGDETTDRDGEGRERSRLVLRVPPGQYGDVLRRISGLGVLKERRVSAKDVTDEVVDVDSRLKNQRKSVARVRELMDRAKTITDIVALEAELSRRQAELESLEARLKSLKDRTGMATLTLVAHQKGGTASDADEGGPGSFGDALAGGWHAFTRTVRWLLVVLGAALPFLAAAGLLYAAWRAVRARGPWWLRRSTRRKGAAVPGARTFVGAGAPARAAGGAGAGADAADREMPEDQETPEDRRPTVHDDPAKPSPSGD
ncbi:DUF4349 domain-containing protein [Streptomyces sp. NPDC003077]|uniref:DUF4349 domain-containing protein n=1 Tax=Streptomyces sp. NPDC003077 TaxID=3154443 RepID=UPI0033BC2793